MCVRATASSSRRVTPRLRLDRAAHRAAITATGLIWSKYSLDIVPVRAFQPRRRSHTTGRASFTATLSGPGTSPPDRCRAAACTDAFLAPVRRQVNYNLMAVNSFMAVTGLYQLGRIA